MMLEVMDCFAGIGGFSLGLERTGGFTPVRFIEIDPFCQRVLAKRWPAVPKDEDITKCTFERGEADVITGGFPCQDVSCAGRRAGLAGARSGLYRELVRAIRVVRPRYAILENVAALLGDGMGTVLGDLAESGADAEWDCVPACTFGAPHERERVFIVAHTDSERRLEPEGIEQEFGRRTYHGREARIADASHAPSLGRRPRRERRPPDSFAGIRDEARRNLADPHGARYAFREGLGRDAWEELPPAQRNAIQNGGQSIWPDEPALSGVDDDVPDWMDRVKATGNTILPIIPEKIGETLLSSLSGRTR